MKEIDNWIKKEYNRGPGLLLSSQIFLGSSISGSISSTQTYLSIGDRNGQFLQEERFS